MRRNARIGLLFFLAFPPVYAYTGFGICNYGKETVASVICYGPTALKETIVSGDIKVTGPLKAISITAGSLSVTGASDIEDATINGATDVTGAFNADNVNFKNDVTLTTKSALLNHSTVLGSVQIKSDTDKPYLKLQCGTAVNGSIKFIGKEGVVQVSEDSIVRGQLDNGEFEFVKVNCK